ncbi:hypothetical protein FOZ76_18605 [Verticiella sediminum]|uniref:UPF0225 protein FOZ76_18605 n=1 Tax=Verticiella sediminum TaxID=1247510 RepID=A0A556AER4_9BURK|nr:YchJ family metal-binding protein [Verticiella sediminum]TSH91384.1 hypothetical protein FOZ76_18605 [Verticiella sediminum]
MSKTAKSMPEPACPCGSGLPYAGCCARWHHGAERLRAPDAQALMRSRYSAFVLDELGYLIDTWHPDTRPAALEPNPAGLKWLGLEVREHRQLDPEHAVVEFVARSRWQGRASRQHERSRFERQPDGRWVYVDGESLA